MGAVFATMGYAVALWFAADGIDVIGATAFGLALLFLMDLSEFGRRFHGATVAVSVIRGQTAYWIARAALILGAVMYGEPLTWREITGAAIMLLAAWIAIARRPPEAPPA